MVSPTTIDKVNNTNSPKPEQPRGLSKRSHQEDEPINLIRMLKLQIQVFSHFGSSLLLLFVENKYFIAFLGIRQHSVTDCGPAHPKGIYSSRVKRLDVRYTTLYKYSSSEKWLSLNQVCLHCAVLLAEMTIMKMTKIYLLDVLAHHQLQCADESQEDETAVHSCSWWPDTPFNDCHFSKLIQT